MSENYPSVHAAVIAHLERLHAAGDRAALAILRRSICKPPGASPEVFRILGGILPESPRAEEDCFLIAALFAMHPENWPRSGGVPHTARNFGASMRRLKDKREGSGVERRFSALLAASREELPEHLRHATNLLRTDEISIDWLQLLDDLLWWSYEERSVQRRWARAFWSTASPELAGNADDSQSDGQDSQEGDE